MVTKVTIPTGTKMVNLQHGHSFTTTKDVVLGRIAPSVYIDKNNRLYTTAKAPTMKRLEKMALDMVATTPCGCRTDIDGPCEHGVPNWVQIIGAI